MAAPLVHLLWLQDYYKVFLLNNRFAGTRTLRRKKTLLKSWEELPKHFKKLKHLGQKQKERLQQQRECCEQTERSPATGASPTEIIKNKQNPCWISTEGDLVCPWAGWYEGTFLMILLLQGTRAAHRVPHQGKGRYCGSFLGRDAWLFTRETQCKELTVKADEAPEEGPSSQRGEAQG